MMSQISGPCCDSYIEPDEFKSFVWESHVRQQIFVIFEDCYCQKKKIQLTFNNVYPELVKCNQWSIIHAVFWLVELLLGYMYVAYQ